MANKQKKMQETEIAEVAQMFFEQRGWDMYPEVVLPNFNGRPDIVGEKMEKCLVVECKGSLTYPVLEQLTRWHHDWKSAEESEYRTTENRGIPHLLVAFTERGKGSFPDLKKEILDRYRIGYYSIEREAHPDKWLSDYYIKQGRKLGVFEDHSCQYDMYYKNYRWIVREEISPKIQHGSRRSAHNILKHLNKDMKVGIAGSTGKDGAYMTPFKRTMNKVNTVLERGGVWHIQHIVEAINKDLGGHHYCSDSSAKGGISKFIIELKIGVKTCDYAPKYELYKDQ